MSKRSLVDRLRANTDCDPECEGRCQECPQDRQCAAADEIERLRLALYQVKEGGHWRDIPTAALAANI